MTSAPPLPPPGAAPAFRGAAAVLADIEAGDVPLTLPRAMSDKRLSVNGRKPNASTGWRWTKRGATSASGQRVLLEVARVGSIVVTTGGAITRFLQRLSNPKSDNATLTPAQLRREHQAAEKALDAVGLR